MQQSENNVSRVILRGVSDNTLRSVVAECMEFCDWKSLIPPDSTVLIKPNLCTAVPGKCEMANTDPRIAEALCEVLLTRTRKVVLAESDGLRQTAWQAFEESGYVPFAKRLGVELMNLSESPQTAVDVSPVHQVKLPDILLQGHPFITLPVLKTHALTYFTGSIKNQWGCLPQYDRILYHRYLDPMLASMHAIFKPCISIMDGIIGMEGRGPANGKPRRIDLLLASRDSVAVDCTAMRLVGLHPELCRHVQLTSQLGLGNWEAGRITVDGDWEKHHTQFKPAVLDKAIAAMDYMSRYRWFVKYMLEKNYVFYPIRAAVQIARRIGIVEGRD